MDLVRKTPSGGELEIDQDLTKLMKSPNQAVISSIATIKPEYKSVAVSAEAVGIVTYDTRYLYTISVRVAGRIEKMYLKYEFQKVKKGEKIAEIYSPELITAQRELLYVIEKDGGNNELVASAKQKLKLLGLSASEVSNLIAIGKIQNSFPLHSPYDGYLIINEASPVSQSYQRSSADGMSEMNSASSGIVSSDPIEMEVSSATLVREGDYVSADETLARIVNLSALRIELDVRAVQVEGITRGDQVELDFGNGNKETASVDFVQPFYNQGENFAKIRVYLRNAERLRIGQLVRAKIKLKPKEALWIPMQSVVDLGMDKIVFVKDRGLLRPQKITTGIRENNLIEVKGGLTSSDEIASNAQYLVDSESFIKPLN